MESGIILPFLLTVLVIEPGQYNGPQFKYYPQLSYAECVSTANVWANQGRDLDIPVKKKEMTEEEQERYKEEEEKPLIFYGTWCGKNPKFKAPIKLKL